MPRHQTADFVSLWRARLRAYGTALLLSAASIGVLPETRPVTPVAIVRSTERRRSPFDPLEQFGESVVTVPLIVGADLVTPERRRPVHLN
jgi:hypothetical protein